MISTRRALHAALLATSMLVCAPAFAQVPETPNEDPTADPNLQPPQDTTTPETDAAAQDPAAQESEEIVVRGRFIPNVKRETSEIVSVLDQAALQRTGDSDIGSALSRVTGLSLVGGRFVYVRGLGGRYSAAILDGSVLPSPEPLRRVVPLDVFPTDLLSGAVVQKTYSVQYPGEFGGGLVALTTKAVPDKPFFEIGVSTGYNDNSTFEDGFTFEGGDFDSLGFADFHYDVPPNVLANPSLNGFDEGQLQLAGRDLVNARPRYSIDIEENRPDIGLNLTAGTRFDLGGMSLGVIGALSFENEVRNNFGTRTRFTTALDEVVPLKSLDPSVCAGFNDALDPATCGLRQTVETVSLGGVLGIGLEIDEQNEVKATSTIVRKADKLAEIQRGTDPQSDSNNIVSDQRIAFIEQELWVNQLTGKHEFGLGAGSFTDLEVNWRGSYARASRTTPFLTSYRYVIGQDSDGFSLAAQTPRNSRRFTALTDDNYEGGLDLALKGALGGMETIIKLGGQYNKKERGYASRTYSFEIPSTAGATGLLDFVPEIIFSPDNIGPGGLILRQLDGPANSYNAEQEIYGAYAALELQLIDQVRLTGGVRYENSKQIVDGFAVVGSVPTNDRCAVGEVDGFNQPLLCTLEQSDWLPAATVTWEFADNMQVRVGYSKTLSRPDLRELSPAVILNIEEDIEEQGDPTLEITKIDNFDARYEWYFGRQQILSLGGFYKKLNNPIERSLSSFGEGGRRVFINADSAEVYGGEVELELTVPLDQWAGGGFFADRRFFVIGNVTYSKSEVTIAPEDQGILFSLVRPLEGQSEWLVNGQVGWEKEGERFAVLFNYASERIFDVGTARTPDVYEVPQALLDVVAAKEIGVGGVPIEIGFKATNLLGEDLLRTQGGLTYERYPLGRTFSLGLKTRF